MSLFSLSAPPTYLTADQEARLVDWLLSMAKIGYGVTRQEIPNIVKDLLDKYEADGYEIPADRKFVDNKPSKNWVSRFIGRHPNISPRTPENLGFQRTHITEERIKDWFSSLEKFLNDEHNIDAAEYFKPENGSRVFNLDESGFPLQGTNQRLKIIAEKGIKNVHRISSDTREQITVLACVAANGTFEKPLVVFPGQRMPKYNFGNIDAAKYSLGHSMNGWMTSDVFFTWLSSIFYPSVKDRVTFPIIVFLDGHTSHINLAVAEFCRDHSIILFCFPPHASHVLQPLDVTIFGPLKKKWNASIENFRLLNKVSITRSHFFHVFDPAWESCVAMTQNVIAGFRCCGLVPFNVNNVDFKKLIDRNVKERFERRQERATSGGQTGVYERLGAIKLFQLFEGKLTPELKQDFDKRLDENYDLEDRTPKGILWSFYRDSKKFLQQLKNSNQEVVTFPQNWNSTRGENNDEVDTSPNNNVINESARNDMQPVIEQVETPVPQVIEQMKTPASSSFIEQVETPFNETSMPSCSTVRECEQSVSPLQKPYMNCQFSPFKKYLTIRDPITSTKKNTSVKPKHSPAFTGIDHLNFLRRTQREKEKLEEEKEKRKKERELKKKLKEQAANNKGKRGGKRVRETAKEDEQDTDKEDQEMVFMDSDSDLDIDNENKCEACFGNEDLDDNSKWIGCNKCPRWFHKGCVSDDVEEMDEEELREFNFICHYCSKAVKKKEQAKKVKHTER